MCAVGRGVLSILVTVVSLFYEERHKIRSGPAPAHALAEGDNILQATGRHERTVFRFTPPRGRRSWPDTARPSSFDRGGQACDCSCHAFKELQAIGDLPKEQLQAHPKAMALIMCAPKCGMTWATQCGGG